MDRALVSLHGEAIINPSMFLFAFVNSLLAVKHYSRDLVIEDVEMVIRRFDSNVTVEEIKSFLLGAGSLFPRVAPFLSRNGLFGLNTYLYLFFNGIYPISFSINTYTVHGRTDNPLLVSIHDLLHTCALREIVDLPSVCYNKGLDIFRGVDIPKLLPGDMTKKEYFEKLRSVYLDVLDMAIGTEYLDREVKGYLFVLFHCTHEDSTPVGVEIPGNRSLPSIDTDFLPVLLNLVDPKKFGISRKFIKDNRNIYLFRTPSLLESTIQTITKVYSSRRNFLERFGRYIYREFFDIVSNDMTDLIDRELKQLHKLVNMERLPRY